MENLQDLKLVHLYNLVKLSEDLRALELGNKANQKFSERKYEEALELYNQAFSLSPNDHLILGKATKFLG